MSFFILYPSKKFLAILKSGRLGRKEGRFDFFEKR
jgi:hypothetical protein